VTLDELGDLVRGARRYRLLPQKTVARKAGVSVGTVAAVEAGRSVGSTNLWAVMGALGIKLARAR
jgi:DNA-binding XRE family transcriptional regulator